MERQLLTESDLERFSHVKSDPYIKLYNNFIWLQNQCREVQIAIEYEKSKSDETPSEEENIEKIHNILLSVQDKIDENIISDIVVSRLQLGDALYKATFSGMGVLDESSDIMQDIVPEQLQDRIHKLLVDDSKIMSQTSKEYKVVKSLRSEILDMQLELSESYTDRICMNMEIQLEEEKRKAKEEAAKTDNIKKMIEKSEKVANLIFITNHILQLLICYSGLNWGKHGALREMIKEFGKPLREQLESADLD